MSVCYERSETLASNRYLKIRNASLSAETPPKPPPRISTRRILDLPWQHALISAAWIKCQAHPSLFDDASVPGLIMHGLIVSR